MEDFQAIITKIKKEKKHKDIANACKKVGVTRTVYDTAIKKTSFEDLTASESSVISTIVTIIDKRSEDFKKLKSYAS